MMKKRTLVVTIDNNNGTIECLHTDDIDLTAIGHLEVRRASHVKFVETAQKWSVTLVDGTNLGLFKTRKKALVTEVDYLNRKILNGTIEEVFQ